jgi:hypothetical protein
MDVGNAVTRPIGHEPGAEFGIDRDGIERHQTEGDRHRKHRVLFVTTLLADKIHDTLEPLVEVLPIGRR